MAVEAEIDRLPIDLLAHIFVLITSFTDLAQVSSVCRKWRKGVTQSLGGRHNLSFAGCKMDDVSTARLVRHAYSLKELDISRSRWGCQISDNGLYQISLAKCVSNLTSISLWGMTGVTDKGVAHLVRIIVLVSEELTFFILQCQFDFIYKCYYSIKRRDQKKKKRNS
uniref:F-box domain-containing protein n=1 Tax=Cannabis sativa TaxID=3483 RepID=A0ABL6VB78_CANSA